MWLYLIVGALAVVGLAGGAVMGGVFTIVLLPIAAIVLVGGLVYTAMGRAGERQQSGGPAGAGARGGGATQPPLPHSAPSQPGHVRTSPEALADARRVQQ
jgi:hypothetical protein